MPIFDVFVLSFQLKGCMTQLATSTDDETQWKYLNFQVLLSLRSPDATVGQIIEKLVKIL